MFQPRAQGGREHQAEAGPRQLKPRLVLALPPGALAGEQRAHHGAAGALDRGEVIAGTRGEQQRQRAQHELTKEDLHGSPSRKRSHQQEKRATAAGSMTTLEQLRVTCRYLPRSIFQRSTTPPPSRTT